MEKKPERITIDTEIMEGIIRYLMTKPFGEVNRLMKAIEQDMKPFAEQDIEPEKEAVE